MAEVAPSFEELSETVLNPHGPIGKRMRALFWLKMAGGDDAVRVLCEALKKREGGTLFRHDAAYVLGQMRNHVAIPTLNEILRGSDDDPIVRHEAAEALGAISAPESLAILTEYSADPVVEVAETCQIAARRLQWVQEGGKEDTTDDSAWESVDPAPAVDISALTVAQLTERLMDRKLALFERYQAMFALRNKQTDESVKALVIGFQDASALFRHEIAFVLGQMCHSAAVPGLVARLEDPEEHEMVRHEAAEALGSIGGEEVEELLRKYIEDGRVIVRESCAVALDIADYWKPESSSDEGEE